MPAIRIDPAQRMGLAVGLSLLAHAALFSIPMRERVEGMLEQAAGSGAPLAVRLLAPDVPAAVPEPAAPPPVTPRRQAQPAPSAPTLARVAPAPEPAPFRLPMPASPPVPQFDMAALIAANRERRRAAEAAALSGPGRAPTADERALANINRNLQNLARSDGTGGMFQIMRMGARSAEFAFNGWNPESRGKWREYIEVEAGPDGNLERAVVRRMITLIREHYTGDFRWDSHRLGRVLVLSAAPADNEGLEDFLMREFFGTPLVRR